MSERPLVANRYRLERPLGHGGMAVVELAEDVELRRTVAVKLLADNLARDDEVRRRFLREAQLAAALAHPNVVRVFDVGDDAAGRPFLVMEYVDGETAADLLHREGPLPVDRAIDLAVQACAGLQAAHDAGLVHRDVKPQNLLVRSDGVVKLADFGIARASSAAATKLTATGTLLGTAAYAAPEQLEGGEVTPAADVYGIGAVLYELLTGRPPRTVRTLADTDGFAAPITPPRELRPEIGVALEQVVMRCLARDPRERPHSAGALAEELQAAHPDAETRPLVPPARPLRRRRVPLLPLAVVAALAAIGVGLGVALSSSGGGSSAGTTSPAPRVAPVPHSNDPVQQARNLARWLRQNSR